MRSNLLKVVLGVILAVLVAVPLTANPIPQVEEAFFDSDGIKIRYIVAGVGEPVVLLHGFTSNGDTWQRLGIFADLAQDYRVIACDLRGHGKSDKPHDPSKYGMAMVDDVVRLMDHLRIAKAHVVGFSMGGMITLKLITKYPNRLISAVPGGYGWNKTDGPDGDKSWHHIAEGLARDRSFRCLFDVLTPGDRPSFTSEQIEAFDQTLSARNDIDALICVARAFTRLPYAESEFRANKVPTLLIVGDKDALKPEVDRLRGVMGHAKFAVIPDADHIQTLLRPEYRKLVRDFLAKHAVD